MTRRRLPRISRPRISKYRSNSLPTANCQQPIVAIALGSNLGDRQSHLEFAVERLRRVLHEPRVSQPIETDPVGVPPQPKYLNAAMVGSYNDTPQELLQLLLAIEGERGRVRPFPGAARTLDLDLVIFGDCVLTSGTLMLPHPRFRERKFVLEPLAEIAPELIDPVTGKTVRELLQEIGG